MVSCRTRKRLGLWSSGGRGGDEDELTNIAGYSCLHVGRTAAECTGPWSPLTGQRRKLGCLLGSVELRRSRTPPQQHHRVSYDDTQCADAHAQFDEMFPLSTPPEAAIASASSKMNFPIFRINLMGCGIHHCPTISPLPSLTLDYVALKTEDLTMRPLPVPVCLRYGATRWQDLACHSVIRGSQPIG